MGTLNWIVGGVIFSLNWLGRRGDILWVLLTG